MYTLSLLLLSMFLLYIYYNIWFQIYKYICLLGFYHITDADGRLRRVDYTAGPEGFRATIQSNEEGLAARDSADAVFNVQAPSAQQQAAAASQAQAAASQRSRGGGSDATGGAYAVAGNP